MNRLNQTIKYLGTRLTFKYLWQWLAILTYFTLFWTLAIISPYTDKSNSLLMVVGEIVLLITWAACGMVTFIKRDNIRINFWALVFDYPQLWVAMVYLVISARDIAIIPMCDNAIYFKNFLNAILKFDFLPGPSFGAMISSGHPTLGYASYMMLGQFVDYANSTVLNLQTRILTVIGILSFAGIINKLFTGKFLKVDRFLITSLYAFTPLIYGMSLTPSADYAVLIFLCVLVYLYIQGDTILAIFVGLMLVFSKEVGVLLYASFIASLFVVLFPYQVWNDQGKFRLKRYLVKALRNSYLAIPLLFFLVYILTYHQLWNYKSFQGLSEIPTALSFQPGTFYEKSIQIFLANFNWVVWGIVILGIGIGIVRRWRGVTLILQPETIAWVLVLVVTLIPFLVVNFSFQTWDNPRYNVPVIFFELIFLVTVLVITRIKPLWRSGILGGILVLFLLGCFRTVDPILLHFFPTFRVGEHRISFYNSVHTVCDLTLYNGEYVYYYDRLFDLFLQQTKFHPQQDHFIFMSNDPLIVHNISFLWTGNDATGDLYIDPQTLTRTYQAENNIRLSSKVYQGADSIDITSLPVHAYTFQIFWKPPKRPGLENLLNTYYKMVRKITIEDNGYSLDGYELVLRSEFQNKRGSS